MAKAASQAKFYKFNLMYEIESWLTLMRIFVEHDNKCISNTTWKYYRNTKPEYILQVPHP